MIQSTAYKTASQSSRPSISLPCLYKKLLHLVRGDLEDDTSLFVCASNALFGDNTLDRKSLQGYIMKLLGGPVAWRANKQDTVTTLSTEAELVAVSQTAREAIYLSCLLIALNLKIPGPLSIDCDNLQTI